MNIIEKEVGTKISYSLSDTKLTFNDEITLDLSKYERDFAVHLDVCMNSYGMLTMGLSSNYVAQIDILERQYTYTDGGFDEHGLPTQIKTAVAFNTTNVTLTLWKVGG